MHPYSNTECEIVWLCVNPFQLSVYDRPSIVTQSKLTELLGIGECCPLFAIAEVQILFKVSIVDSIKCTLIKKEKKIKKNMSNCSFYHLRKGLRTIHFSPLSSSSSLQYFQIGSNLINLIIFFDHTTFHSCQIGFLAAPNVVQGKFYFFDDATCHSCKN